MEENTAIGDQVLVQGTLLSGRKTVTLQDGKQVEMVLVRIEGQKTPIVVSIEHIFRPSGERYILTATDFDPTLPTFARNIRQLRQKANLTQYELSRAIGVEQQSVSRWEAGKCGIALRHADKIAAALGVPVAALLAKA